MRIELRARPLCWSAMFTAVSPLTEDIVLQEAISNPCSRPLANDHLVSHQTCRVSDSSAAPEQLAALAPTLARRRRRTCQLLQKAGHRRHPHPSSGTPPEIGAPTRTTPFGPAAALPRFRRVALLRDRAPARLRVPPGRGEPPPETDIAHDQACSTSGGAREREGTPCPASCQPGRDLSRRSSLNIHVMHALARPASTRVVPIRPFPRGAREVR